MRMTQTAQTLILTSKSAMPALLRRLQGRARVAEAMELWMVVARGWKPEATHNPSTE